MPVFHIAYQAHTNKYERFLKNHKQAKKNLCKLLSLFFFSKIKISVCVLNTRCELFLSVGCRMFSTTPCVIWPASVTTGVVWLMTGTGECCTALWTDSTVKTSFKRRTTSLMSPNYTMLPLRERWVQKGFWSNLFLISYTSYTFLYILAVLHSTVHTFGINTKHEYCHSWYKCIHIYIYCK